MSEYIAQVRFTRRWQNYYPNDVAVFPLGMAQGLVAQRVADALPPPVGAVAPAGDASSQPGGPPRQPPQMTRK